MTWTSEKPTSDGWYWYTAPRVPPCVVQVWTRDNEGRRWVSGLGVHGALDWQTDAYWSGPITPPSREGDSLK